MRSNSGKSQQIQVFRPLRAWCNNLAAVAQLWIASSRSLQWRSLSHRLMNEFVCGFRQQFVRGFAVDLLAANLEHHRNCERRHTLKLAMRDMALDSRQHVVEATDVQQPGGGIGARRTQQNVVWLVLAQHI